MFLNRGFLVSFAFLLSACSGSITFRSPVDYTADLDAYSSAYASAGLVYMSSITNVTCPSSDDAGDAACQDMVDAANPGSGITVHCNSSLKCDPAAYKFLIDLGVQDLEDLANPEVSVIDRIELLRVEAARLTNTANIDVPASELHWGTESSSSANLGTSTQRLASVPVMTQGVTGPLDITLNDAGLTALDSYIQNTSTKVRFFLITELDLAPGQAIPAGKIEMTLGLIIRATGRLR
jgi:hypothetical protein